MSLRSSAVLRSLVGLAVTACAFALAGAVPAAAQAPAASAGVGAAAASAGLLTAEAQVFAGSAAAGAGADAGSGSSAGASAGEDAAAVAPTATRAVAARDMERGEVLTAADIRYVAVPAGDASAEEPATLVGWRTRRVIDEGEPLREPAVSPPDLVRAGETVQAVYRGKSIVLRVMGTAAGSGAMGERVLVRVDARRRLEGVVIGPALVELDTNESR